MKTWLKEFGKFPIEPRVSPLVLMVLVILMGLLIGFNFYLGGWAEAKETETCALCEGRQHYAPCLVNLATGQVGELQMIGGEREAVRTSLFFVAGASGMCGGDAHTCTVTLPEKAEQIEGAYFCRDCRAKLAEVATEGYVLADLYDTENFALYPITAGAEYVIREYTVTVLQEETERLTVRVAESD